VHANVVTQINAASILTSTLHTEQHVPLKLWLSTHKTIQGHNTTPQYAWKGKFTEVWFTTPTKSN